MRFIVVMFFIKNVYANGLGGNFAYFWFLIFHLIDLTAVIYLKKNSSQTCPECRKTTTTNQIFRLFFKISPLDNAPVKVDNGDKAAVKPNVNLFQELKMTNEELVKNLEKKTKELLTAQQNLEKSTSSHLVLQRKNLETVSVIRPVFI